MHRPEEPRRSGNTGQAGNQANLPAGRPLDHDGGAPPAEEGGIAPRSAAPLDGERGDRSATAFPGRRPLGSEARADAKPREETGSAETPPRPPSKSVVVTVTDPHGLHLRSGRDVVRTASRFQARITASNLSRNSRAVDMKSILQLMQLQARQGHDLQLAASGPDAAAAIDALCSLF